MHHIEQLGDSLSAGEAATSDGEGEQAAPTLIIGLHIHVLEQADNVVTQLSGVLQRLELKGMLRHPRKAVIVGHRTQG